MGVIFNLVYHPKVPLTRHAKEPYLLPALNDDVDKVVKSHTNDCTGPVTLVWSLRYLHTA